MRPPGITSRGWRCARILPWSALLLWTSLAMGQTSSIPQSRLTPDVCSRLAESARDASLEPWQRTLMLELAQGGTELAAVEPTLALAGPESPPARSTAGDSAGLAVVLPPVRYGHTAIYDPVRDRMVVFGGADAGSLNNVWALALSGRPAWSALAPSGDMPSARYGHTAIYDPVRDRMVVFGGWNGSSYSNDVWALSLSASPAWSRLAPTGTLPSARYGHTAIYDPVRERMVVFGGHDDFSSRKDAWELSLSGNPAWSALVPTGSQPPPRYGHTAIYDPVRDRMLVFGGYDDNSGSHNDTWALSLSGHPAWSALAPAGHRPSPRSGHTAIYERAKDRMVVFGGTYADFAQHDAWALSLSGTPAWSALAPTTTTLPSGRSAHTAIYDSLRVRMVAFGGHGAADAPVARSDTWALSLSGTPAWTAALAPAAVTSAPGANASPGTPPPANSTPMTGGPHPQIRHGFFLGLGLARGSADLNPSDVNGDRSSGWGGSFRLGYAITPKFALGIESNTWVEVGDASAADAFAVTLGTFTGAVTVFPAQGLVLRAGLGGGDWAGAGQGTSGEVGTGWTAGAAYEFRVARGIAIGPQFDYSQVLLKDVNYSYYNFGLSMNWYFIGK